MTNEEREVTPQATNPEVHATTSYAPQLPECKNDDVEMWFALVEAVFTASRITSEKTKYAMILPKLPTSVAMEARDLILGEPGDAPYTTFKTEILKRLGTTEDQRTRRLLESEEMGDQKPSQFLRRLQHLAGKNMSESTVRALWKGRLPRELQAILEIVKDQPLEKAAEIADASIVHMPIRPSLAEVNRTAPKQEDSLVEEMRKLSAAFHQEVATMKREMAAERAGRDPVQNNSSSQKHKQRRSRSRSRSNSRSQRPADLCWYHWRFDTKATRCTTPCVKSPGNQLGGR
ncbi:uncharacterized protein LOC123272885 [Cotesia glomerata]|uniref:uncharacterized protein LOC123272885 n=1 Tax=Cotesia glomerata TaxID=32391 RepID=UPI001D001C4C|nr:uncharacterized protein LOC123272885 [Cotesia glomerata]